MLLPYLITLSLFLPSLTETLYKIRCADALEIDTCQLTNMVEKSQEERIQTTYYKACKKGKQCIEINDYYQCVKGKQRLDIDEKCVLSDECRSKFCNEGKCSYLPDKDCKLGLGCGVTSGVDPTCIELFSLNDGDKSTLASLCKSNHIYTDSTLGSICVSSSIKDGKCNDAHKCRIKYTYRRRR